MMLLIDLPIDCLIHILSLLSPRDIETCNLVSRALHTAINDCLLLQYRILLDRFGFVPTRNTGSPALELKVSILQEKWTRRNQSQGTQSGAIQLENHTSIINVQFSRGIIIVENTPLTSSLDLKLHELASSNRGTEHKHSLVQVTNLPAGNIGPIKFEAALDLLVLVYYQTPNDMRFSLRSLKTGSPHPWASLPTIINSVVDISSPGYYTRNVEIVDRQIVHLGESLSRSTPLLTTWNWITGELVTSTPVPGFSYAFVSKDIFIVASDQTRCGGEFILLALSVFTLQGVSQGGAARFVASLCLPATDGPSRPVFELYCTPPIPIHDPHGSYAPARIFCLDHSSHYLALRLTARPTVATRIDATGILFIHSLGLRTLAERLAATRQSPVFVRWDNWGFMTCWLKVKHPIPWRGIYGHRAAFLTLDPSTGDCEILVYDLRVTRRPRLRRGVIDLTAQLSLDDQMDRLFSVKGKPIRHPMLTSSFWVGPDVIPQGRAREYYFDLKMDDEHGKHLSIV
ncbi:unnamed protein product [Rhizoctonia solani]|uniref:F-box domain-containing protein n=1 Tax=Rhizoctonia solani TaxID=456999 RepID=A0A8H3CU36_9AGAM|nr:unnamed protein product [Rhizoctonia solani]